MHIENTISAATNLVGWALRTFRRRSKFVMMTLWKSLVQSKLDYCSQLWCPTDQSAIGRIESVARHFTSQISGIEELGYWERLQVLKLYSQERRRERYRIIFIWKVLQGYVLGYPNTVHCPRRGRLVEVANYPSQASAAVRRAREASLSVHGPKLFNLLPRDIRNINTGTVDQFKGRLDAWLQSIPDQPTTAGRQRAAASNSLIDQAAYSS